MRRILPILLLVLAAAEAPLRAAEPVKVATLLPYIEEALRTAAPGRARVVAGVRRTEGGALAQGVADLGSPHSPNFERLAASGAEVVVVDERIHKALEPRLRAVGVEVLSVRGDSVEGTFAGIQTAARRAGADREMAARVQETRTALQRLALPRPVPVLVLFGAPGSFLVVTPDTWLGDLLESLGFRNVAPRGTGRESRPGYLEVNDEVMASLRPELVLLVTHGDPEEIRKAFLRKTAEGGAWRGLSNVRHGVHVLDPALFATNPGLRMVDAGRRLTGLAAGGR